MQLLLTNCNTTFTMTDGMASEARAAARAGTTVTALTPTWGPASCEGWLDSFVSAAAVLDVVAAHRDAGNSVDALVMAGFGEHGRQGARELLDGPVVDITEAAAIYAGLLGDQYAVITSLSRTIPLIEDSLRSSRLLERCHSLQATDMPVLELEADPDATVAAFAAPARKAIEAGADVLILGCAGMSSLRSRLAFDLGVPVIDGIAAAVTLAESLHHLGLKTSRAHGYAAPLLKDRTGWQPRPRQPL